MYNYYYYYLNCKNETVLGEKDDGKATTTIINITLKPRVILQQNQNFNDYFTLIISHSKISTKEQ